MPTVDKKKNPTLEMYEKKGLLFVFNKIMELHNTNT